MSVTRSQQFARFTAFTIATSLLMSASVYAQQSVTTPPAPLVNAPSTSDAALENATPAQLYNAGVTAYRAKDFAAAREMFALAAAQGKADLAARSMYNRGTTQYAASVDAMAAAQAQAPGASAAPTPESQQQQQQQLMESLESALRELKDAARADPSNADARANAELAHRVLKELKKKQEQEKKDQQKQDQQKQDQEQKDQQKQDQEQQDQEGKDQESKDPQSQEQKDQAKKDQEQKAQEKKDQDKKEQEQKKQDQQQEDQAKLEQQKQEQQQSQAEQAEKKPMSKQDVERLLQKIRDREKQRIQEKLVRERAKTQPAPKDW